MQAAGHASTANALAHEVHRQPYHSSFPAVHPRGQTLTDLRTRKRLVQGLADNRLPVDLSPCP
eukprot:355983-Chlamydomonas_euryale.AAC.7